MSSSTTSPRGYSALTIVFPFLNETAYDFERLCHLMSPFLESVSVRIVPWMAQSDEVAAATANRIINLFISSSP